MVYFVFSQVESGVLLRASKKMYGFRQLQCCDQSIISASLFEFFNKLYFIAWKADQQLLHIKKTIYKAPIEAFTPFDFSTIVLQISTNESSYDAQSNNAQFPLTEDLYIDFPSLDEDIDDIPLEIDEDIPLEIDDDIPLEIVNDPSYGLFPNSSQMSVNYHTEWYEEGLSAFFNSQISSEEFVSFVEKLFQRPSPPNLAKDLQEGLQKCSGFISVIYV